MSRTELRAQAAVYLDAKELYLYTQELFRTRHHIKGWGMGGDFSEVFKNAR